MIFLNPLHRRFPISSSFEDHKARTPPSKAPGTDYAAGWGEPVFAAHAGTVNASRDWPNGGLGLYIHHPNGVLRTGYMHLWGIVEGGFAVVKAGQHIGFVGSSGRSTGPHLHFAVKHKIDGVWRWVDPELMLAE
jgi:murein DD-endopeptidase MepM/ murein hydrolase activator NlpD